MKKTLSLIIALLVFLAPTVGYSATPTKTGTALGPMSQRIAAEAERQYAKNQARIQKQKEELWAMIDQGLKTFFLVILTLFLLAFLSSLYQYYRTMPEIVDGMMFVTTHRAPAVRFKMNPMFFGVAPPLLLGLLYAARDRIIYDYHAIKVVFDKQSVHSFKITKVREGLSVFKKWAIELDLTNPAGERQTLILFPTMVLGKKSDKAIFAKRLSLWPLSKKRQVEMWGERFKKLMGG